MAETSKPISRRTFLKFSALAGAGLALKDPVVGALGTIGRGIQEARDNQITNENTEKLGSTPQEATKNFITAMALGGIPLSPFGRAMVARATAEGIYFSGERVQNNMLRFLDRSGGSIEQAVLSGDWLVVVDARKRSPVFRSKDGKFYLKIGTDEVSDNILSNSIERMQAAYEASTGSSGREIFVRTKVNYNGRECTGFLSKDLGTTLEAELAVGNITLEQVTDIYRQAFKAAVKIYEKTGVLVTDVNAGNIIPRRGKNGSWEFGLFMDFEKRHPQFVQVGQQDELVMPYLMGVFNRGVKEPLGDFKIPFKVDESLVKEAVAGTRLSGVDLKRAFKYGARMLKADKTPFAVLMSGESWQNVRGEVAREIGSTLDQALANGDQILVVQGIKGEAVEIDLRGLFKGAYKASLRESFAKAFGSLGRMAETLGDVAMLAAFYDFFFDFKTAGVYEDISLPQGKSHGGITLSALWQKANEIKENRARQGMNLDQYSPPNSFEIGPEERESLAAESGQIGDMIRTSGGDDGEIMKILELARREMIAKDSYPILLKQRGDLRQILSFQTLPSNAYYEATLSPGGLPRVTLYSFDGGKIIFDQGNDGKWEVIEEDLKSIRFTGSNLNRPVTCLINGVTEDGLGIDLSTITQ